MKRNENMQPWLDYFGMLHTYEENGFLEMKPGEHEAYVTQPALHAMSDGDDPRQQMESGAIATTVRRLRAYAGYRSQQGEGYLHQGFAVHVVKDEAPHDLLYTILLNYVRPWWCPWRKREHIEVIPYDDKP